MIGKIQIPDTDLVVSPIGLGTVCLLYTSPLEDIFVQIQ